MHRNTSKILSVQQSFQLVSINNFKMSGSLLCIWFIILIFSCKQYFYYFFLNTAIIVYLVTSSSSRPKVKEPVPSTSTSKVEHLATLVSRTLTSICGTEHCVPCGTLTWQYTGLLRACVCEVLRTRILILLRINYDLKIILSKKIVLYVTRCTE